MYDVIIIGAGVIGGSIFRELTKYNLKILVLEKENDVAMGITKANSAIIHAGFDPNPKSVVAKYNVKGNSMYEKLCFELDVPFKRNGSLVIAFDNNDLKTLEKLYENGKKMGVPDLKLLSREETLEKEPNLNEKILGALWAPSGGIVCPLQYTAALFENATQNGGEIKLRKEVVSIKKEDNLFYIETHDGNIYNSRYVINAAGLYADKIHNMITKESFFIKPRLGEYIIFDKNQGDLFKSTIFQCPSKLGKGILVTPTVHNNLFIGPDAIDVESKNDTGTFSSGLEKIKEVALLTTNKINFRESIKNFAGLRPIPSNNDFIIEENSEICGFIDVAGMKSPGLTSAPAIAEDIINILSQAGLDLIKKENFNPIRKVIKFSKLSGNEKNELIKKNPLYGRIICRCENITEGEIVDAINRCFDIATVDAIKRRCRPGMGRCQGSFCSPSIVEIIARENKIPKESVLMDGANSKILFGKTK